MEQAAHKRMRVVARSPSPPLPDKTQADVDEDANISSSSSSTPDSAQTPPAALGGTETPREHVYDQYDVETPRYSAAGGSANSHASHASSSSAPAPLPPPPPPPPPSSSRTAPDFSHWQVPPADYSLVRLLGSGSYGDVAEAVDLRHGDRRLVAIKRIHNVFDQATDTKRILREVTILRQLDDDRLVRLLDILAPPAQAKDTFNELYLVFEYMKTDLAKLIAGPQYLRIQHVQFLLYQLLGALKYMHASSVVHRDLKPANILINDDCTLKVCDFGLARFLHTTTAAPVGPASPSSSSSRNPDDATSAAGDEANSTPTSSSSAVAASNSVTPLRVPPLQRQLTKHVVTRWYRSPEIILYQQYSTPVDVWSCGCIFAELLSMQKTSVPHYQDRVPLFPGKTCFPLSCDNDRTYKDQLDQLNVIFDLIGTPGAEDIATLTEVGGYLRALPKKPARDLAQSFPGAPKEAIDLLTRMFAFNPHKRISVDDALAHPFFDSIREQQQQAAAAAVTATVASITGTAISSSIEHLKLEVPLLRGKLLEEIAFYHPDPESSS